MFEIHATVSTDNVQKFKDDCKELGLKSLVIELQSNNGNYQQVMTSDKFNGTDHSTELDKIVKKLTTKGYEIERLKVEYHISYCSLIPLYYECHIRLIVNKDDLEILKEFTIENNWHLSKNPFKELGDGREYRIITYRTKDRVLDFRIKVASALHKLDYVFQIPFDKVEAEACILDTNEELDAKWLNR